MAIVSPKLLTAVLLLAFVDAGICTSQESGSIKSNSGEWSYRGENGPMYWKNIPGSSCGGHNQSPINIQQSTPVQGPQLIWRNYPNIPNKTNITNNGHSLVVQPLYSSDEEKPQLRYDNQIYRLQSIHFHWGRDDYEGSEHALSHRKYPLEMHAVHKRVIDGKEMDEFTVVAVLFERNYERNYDLEQFLYVARDIRRAGTFTYVQPIPASTLIPDFSSHFYTYKGSLTTPPCSETVTWIIRKQVSWVSHEQMEQFRQLRNEEGQTISPNFRPLQPLNDRRIYFVQP